MPRCRGCGAECANTGSDTFGPVTLSEYGCDACDGRLAVSVMPSPTDPERVDGEPSMGWGTHGDGVWFWSAWAGDPLLKIASEGGYATGEEARQASREWLGRWRAENRAARAR